MRETKKKKKKLFEALFFPELANTNSFVAIQTVLSWNPEKPQTAFLA